MIKLSKGRILAILTFIWGNIIMGALYFFLDEKDKTIINFISLFGTFLSVYGLAFAYFQIMSIHATGLQIKSEIERSMLRINQVLSISELSKAGKIIHEIQTYIINQKYEVSLIRMKDLKSILIQIKYNEELSEYTSQGIYNQNITDLGSDINNINDLLTGKRRESIFQS
ncbi:hypothetical protein [Pedobacter steynii]